MASTFKTGQGISFGILDYGSPQIIAARFKDGALRATDMMEPLSMIALDMMEVEKKVFSSGGRRGGGSWKQLAPSTVAKKGSTAILRHTEELYESLTEPGAPHQILDMTRYSFAFGTDRPWSFVHQYGSENMHVPTRPFIKFIQSDYERWDQIIIDYLLKPFYNGKSPVKSVIEDG